MDQNNKKKRKYSDIVSQLHAVELNIRPVDYLPCVICQKKVYDYRIFDNKDLVTCSYDCSALLALSKKEGFLHENDKRRSSFFD